ncbi:MAG: transposase [Aulosira sp. DedQUE10]|nr:transposase [Aulosira sp. DedQUE10]
MHKLSTKVVSENQAIILEDLNVSGMVKNRKLARVISLKGWREFRTLCEAKSQKFGRVFHVISRWEATSQICYKCGYKWGKLDLKVRTVQCLNCGTEHDRDENVAKNINKVSQRVAERSCREDFLSGKLRGVPPVVATGGRDRALPRL